MVVSSAASGQDGVLQRVFGLTLRGPFALPGAARVVAGQPDLVIRYGPALLSADADRRGPYRQEGTQIELEIPDAGRFLLRAPGQLEVAPKPGVDRDTLGAFLIASGLPMLLWRQGGLLLHASGVQSRDGVIALTGPSGVGKSTIARALLNQGGRLLGDDTLWLPDPARPNLAMGLAGGQFLRPAPGSDPHFHALPPEKQITSGQLSALVVLSPNAGQPHRLSSIEAVEAILRARHRPLVPDLLGRTAEVLAHCAQVGGSLPVFRLGCETGQIDAAIAAMGALIGELAA